MCLILFSIIFALMLIYSIIQVFRTKPVELIRQAQSGEREPKTKWLSAIIGLLCIVLAYGYCSFVKNPSLLLTFFFIAVILVIIGTYALFQAASVVILKLLRKNKKYYYKPNHFISVSGLMYRMKQNAAGLSTICILSTMVLVMISSSAALYFGMTDSLVQRYPQDINVEFLVYNEEQVAQVEQKILHTINEFGPEPSAVYSDLQLHTVGKRNGDGYDLSGYDYNETDQTEFTILTATNYTALTGEPLTLETDAALLYTSNTTYGSTQMTVLDKTLSVTEREGAIAAIPYIEDELLPCFLLVVSDAQVLSEMEQQFYTNTQKQCLYYCLGVNVDLPSEQERALKDKILDNLTASEFVNTYYKDMLIDYNINSRQAAQLDFLDIYGTLFFLAIFLGLTFMLAMVLIIYYKQISEGYDDQKQYAIMRKVGLDKRETSRAIHSQLLTMFFLPLVTACIHMLAALPAISKILSLMQLNDAGLFLYTTLASIAIFAVFYSIVYLLTARVYEKLVGQKTL